MTRAGFCAAALGLALRLAFGIGYWVDKPLTQDEREYLSLARSLTKGQGFIHDREVLNRAVEPVGRAPGYPLFLALAHGGRQPTEAVPTSVKVAQSLVGAVGVVLIGVLTSRLAGRRAAIAAALIAACYPPLVWISAYALSEAIVWPMGLLLVWLFDHAMGAGRRSRWVLWPACGIWVGVASLVHPVMLFFLLLGAAWLIWRSTWMPAALFVLGALLVIAPWTVRSDRAYGRLVLIASEGGVTFWTGNHPLARGEGDLAANPQLGRAKQALRARHPQLTGEEMESVYYGEAFAWIRANPFNWALLEMRKLFYLVVPVGPSYRLHSTKYYGLSLISHGLLLPIAALGFRRLRTRRTRLPALWLLAGVSIVSSLVFFPQERFRIPIVDPVLVICAGTVWKGREWGEEHEPRTAPMNYRRSPTTA